MQGGDKESKRMKTELIKWIVDFAPSFKQMKGKLLFTESIPRGSAGTVLRHLLVEKATSPPAPSPDKGFFNTVLSEPSTPSSPSKAEDASASPPKKAVRDSKRRATHSQIERRRREKINDRLVTLRSIVPACAKELEDRRRQKQEEEDEAARIAAGGAPKTYIDAATGKPKRKRNRKKPDTKKAAAGGDKEEELGLHKLEVLTHAINYIFELKAYIEKLETGRGPEHVPTADNPFGVRNRDGTFRQDAKVEDEPGCGLLARPLGVDVEIGVSTQTKAEDDEEEEEEEEEDQIEDDGDHEDDPSEEEDERRVKKHMPSLPSAAPRFKAPTHFRRTEATSSSSSAEPSPAFSTILPSPSTTISPATTITSPMMSLSAESPIMLPDPAISLSKRAAFSALPSSAIPLTGRRESSSVLFKQLSLTSPNFGPKGPKYGEESELRSAGRTPGLSDRDGDANAAELLLNFSTSPEVLRPIVGLRSRSTFSSPQYRPLPAQAKTQVREEEEEEVGLASPPHLALDSSPIEEEKAGDDAMSDKTLEEIVMVKKEPEADAMDVALT